MLSRRTMLGALGASVLLGACGTRESLPASADGDTPRVVTMVPALLDAALAVGTVPVLAAVVGSTAPAHLDGRADQVELMNGMLGVDVERVVGARPDLILTQAGEENEAERLGRVARTVEIVVPEPAGRWKDYVGSVAEALDGAEGLAAAQAEHARRVEAARPALAALRGTCSVLQVSADGVRSYGPDSFAGSLLREAGATMTAAPDGADWNSDGYLDVSREQLAAVAGDTVFLMVRVAEGEDDSEARRDPLWNRLDAVAQGRAHVVDRGTWVHRGYFSAAHVLDEASRLAQD
ncbi:iron complex transport system substrate-binding protein [Pseudonocardia autotrophica]|uniref:Fe(3+)-citrate-binding protein YfmC n=2 Tax=Pseudonocardia TaxID=1847 RepID=A0A1Y2MV79_PSEAH|nr:Fe(3+)-citrate-binding protein YfmC precursor [Pseudonocardia autotrophica]TDN71312.1 iron complex transport system substrate-binding protein [Pseudonocardia autotrophica]BBG01986.1 hypothetical protein Pdca_31950 [Pseudonocardia autotrophica]GEC23150.1 hypothetical protein PSA01_01790 [Pseudonocardia saturnea]